MFELLPHRVAVQPIFDPDMTSSGLLWVPETAKERCDQGIVKYVGKDVELVEPGDYVFFSGYTGTAFQIEGEGVLIIMHDEFITAKIVGDDVLNTDIPGLFFKTVDGKYLLCTYELAIDLIARAMEDASWQNFFAKKKHKQHNLESARMMNEDRKGI